MNIDNLETLVCKGWVLEVDTDQRRYGGKIHAAIRKDGDSSHRLGDTMKQALEGLDHMMAKTAARP